MKRFFRRAMVWLARGAAVLVVLLIVFYAEEDWRGARDWAACQRELAAKGESLDLRQLVPPGKPEDDLSRGAGTLSWDVYLYLGAPVSLYPQPSHYLEGETLDLNSWQKFYLSMPQTQSLKHLPSPAKYILLVLSHYDDEVKEAYGAFSNPNAYWSINYENPLDSRFFAITTTDGLAKFLQLRAIACLYDNRTDLAGEDYLFSFRLNRPFTKPGLLADYIVMIGVRSTDEAILWEGMHRHAWNYEQLQEMEAALGSTDLLALAVNSLRTERAAVLQTMKAYQEMNASVFGTSETPENKKTFPKISLSGLQLRPSGWWIEDRTTFSLGIQTDMDAIDLSRAMISPARFSYGGEPNKNWDIADDTRILATNFMSKPLPGTAVPYGNIFSQPFKLSVIFDPTAATRYSILNNIGLKIAKAETYRRLARLACRLEEYRIGHGLYPDTLDDLPDLPAHLNQEVLSEAPMHYQRKGDGYLLYSVGWNQKDDGGVRADDDKEGDWVWPSP